jgi:hypothetical protein
VWAVSLLKNNEKKKRPSLLVACVPRNTRRRTPLAPGLLSPQPKSRIDKKNDPLRVAARSKAVGDLSPSAVTT